MKLTLVILVLGLAFCLANTARPNPFISFQYARPGPHGEKNEVSYRVRLSNNLLYLGSIAGLQSVALKGEQFHLTFDPVALDAIRAFKEGTILVGDDTNFYITRDENERAIPIRQVSANGVHILSATEAMIDTTESNFQSCFSEGEANFHFDSVDPATIQRPPQPQNSGALLSRVLAKQAELLAAGKDDEEIDLGLFLDATHVQGISGSVSAEKWATVFGFNWDSSTRRSKGDITIYSSSYETLKCKGCYAQLSVGIKGKLSWNVKLTGAEFDAEIDAIANAGAYLDAWYQASASKSGSKSLSPYKFNVLRNVPVFSICGIPITLSLDLSFQLKASWSVSGKVTVEGGYGVTYTYTRGLIAHFRPGGKITSETVKSSTFSKNPIRPSIVAEARAEVKVSVDVTADVTFAYIGKVTVVASPYARVFADYKSTGYAPGCTTLKAAILRLGGDAGVQSSVSFGVAINIANVFKWSKMLGPYGLPEIGPYTLFNYCVDKNFRFLSTPAIAPPTPALMALPVLSIDPNNATCPEDCASTKTFALGVNEINTCQSPSVTDGITQIPASCDPAFADGSDDKSTLPPVSWQGVFTSQKTQRYRFDVTGSDSVADVRIEFRDGTSCCSAPMWCGKPSTETLTTPIPAEDFVIEAQTSVYVTVTAGNKCGKVKLTIAPVTTVIEYYVDADPVWGVDDASHSGAFDSAFNTIQYALQQVAAHWEADTTTEAVIVMWPDWTNDNYHVIPAGGIHIPTALKGKKITFRSLNDKIPASSLYQAWYCYMCYQDVCQSKNSTGGAICLSREEYKQIVYGTAFDTTLKPAQANSPAFVFDGDSKVTVSGLWMTGFTSDTNGGAMLIRGGSDVTVSNSGFEMCEAQDAGADVFVTGQSKVTLAGVSSQTSRAYGRGGAHVAVMGNSVADISNPYLMYTAAWGNNGQGGAILVGDGTAGNGGSLSVTGGLVWQSFSHKRGGAIALMSVNTPVTIKGVSFTYVNYEWNMETEAVGNPIADSTVYVAPTVTQAVTLSDSAVNMCGRQTGLTPALGSALGVTGTTAQVTVSTSSFTQNDGPCVVADNGAKIKMNDNFIQENYALTETTVGALQCVGTSTLDLTSGTNIVRHTLSGDMQTNTKPGFDASTATERTNIACDAACTGCTACGACTLCGECSATQGGCNYDAVTSRCVEGHGVGSTCNVANGACLFGELDYKALEEDNKLNNGEIAGVVIGSVAFVAIAAFAFIYYKRKRAQTPAVETSNKSEPFIKVSLPETQGAIATNFVAMNDPTATPVPSRA